MNKSRIPDASQLPLCEVLPFGDAPCLWLDGKPVFPLMLMTSPPALADLKTLGDLPIHLFTDTFPTGWVSVRQYDYEEFDEKMRGFLRADPQAYVMPRLLLDAPQEWMAAHPEDLVGYADPAGLKDENSWGGARHPSWASPRWRADCAEALRRLLRHALSADYANHIIGWHIGSGIYGEWHHWNAVYYPDTSKCFVEAFRRWLQKRYPANPPQPRVPTVEERRQGDVGMFRDPSRWRWLLDHAEFFHHLGAETLAWFARIVKKYTGGRSIVLAFNGYLPDLGVNQEIDHRAFNRTVRNRNVDAFASPHSYWRRGPGQDAMMRGFLGSVRAHGRLWFDEQDDRTSLASASQYRHVETMEQSVEILWRGFGQVLTHNCGLWFMDQGGMWSGDVSRAWYRHRAIVKTFADMQRVADDSMRRPRVRPSEVAVVSNLRTAFHLADRSSGLDNVTHVLVEAQLEQFERCGAPYDLYLLEDLFESSVPPYKAYVFLDTFFMTDNELARVKALRKAGRTMLFFYAPAFVSESGLSAERVRDLVGMPVEMTKAVMLPGGRQQRPGFVLPNCTRSLSCTGNVFYCPAPPLDASGIRQFLHAARVHIYSESDDPLTVGGGYLSVHAASDGVKHLRWPNAANWTDVRTGRMLGRATCEISVHMTRGQTLILAVE